MLLDEDGEETFEGAENRPVQHDRTVLLAVLANIAGAEPLRQHEVDLEGAALPVAADGIAQHELQLRPIEGALAGIQAVLQARSEEHTSEPQSQMRTWLAVLCL